MRPPVRIGSNAVREVFCQPWGATGGQKPGHRPGRTRFSMSVVLTGIREAGSMKT